jgi:Tfp pilus assembly protein PilO
MRREGHVTDAPNATSTRTGERSRAPQGRDQKQRGEQIKTRLAQFRGTRRARFLGVPEMIALVAAFALFAIAAAAYFLLLVPERSRVAQLEDERRQLQTQTRSAGESRAQSNSTAETVTRILQSLARFESDSLDVRDMGAQQALVEELNEKTKRNNLARPQFSFIYQDDTQTGATQAGQQRAVGNLAGSARRRQTVFPATDISLTIEGTYANLRRFIRDVETSRRFLVINGVQLESLNETGADAAAARGALVSLRLDMTAYFRRTASAQTADASGTTVAPQKSSQ